MEEQFKFQVGDIVACAWLRGEHVLIAGSTERYPLKIDRDGSTYDHNGFYDDTHEVPVLKLVRRPKKEMTFERIKSEGISKLKCGSDIMYVIGFSPVDGSLVTAFHIGGATAAWAETNIKNWEAVE